MIKMNLFVPRGFVNEHSLFHGSPAAEQIARTGFNIRYSRETGLLGGGIYFADQSTKSHRYTQPGGRDGRTRHMLWCKVITGTQYQYRTNNPGPERYNFKSENFFKQFQSVCIIAENHSLIRNNEIAIYKDDQVYPEYLIEYTSA